MGLLTKTITSILTSIYSSKNNNTVANLISSLPEINKALKLSLERFKNGQRSIVFTYLASDRHRIKKGLSSEFEELFIQPNKDFARWRKVFEELRDEFNSLPVEEQDKHDLLTQIQNFKPEVNLLLKRSKKKL